MYFWHIHSRPHGPLTPVNRSGLMTRDEAIAQCDELLTRGVEAWVVHSVSGQRIHPPPSVDSRIRQSPVSVQVRITDTEPRERSHGQEHWFHQYATFKDKIRAEGRTLRTSISFDYINAAGVHTHRTVRVEAVYPLLNETHLLGYCELRSEERTFVPHKMLNVRNEHGDSFSDGAQWLREADGA